MQEIQENVLLAPLSTFQIGGTVRFLVDVRTERDIREAIEWARARALRFIMLGGGSNMLFPDGTLDALVIRFRGDLYGVKEGVVDAWAGTNLLTAIRATSFQGWGGWEKLAGIPGSLGGAVRGNAGAFGPEIKDFVTMVRAFHSETGESKDFSNFDCDFAYRDSYFKRHPEWIITRVMLSLLAVGSEASAALIESTITEREKRHLQNVKAAGSFFMNPYAPESVIELFEQEKGVPSREGRVPAGWLIEKVGMKGAAYGGAQASSQHPNYLVNTGAATASDVLALAQKIKVAVRAHFGIDLMEEACIV